MDWQSIVRTVAPVIGGALGGPLGATALNALASAVLPADHAARAPGTPAAKIEAAIGGALGDPQKQAELLARIKAADQSFAEHMKSLDVDLARLGAQDVEGARQMQIATRSYMPIGLTVFILCAFLAFIGLFLGSKALGLDTAGVVWSMLTMAFTLVIREVTAAFQFWMGSSDGSKSKDQALAQQAQG